MKIRCRTSQWEGGGNEEGDFDEQLLKNQKHTKTRDKLLDILTEHAYDVSSYTRVAVLKTWANIIEKQSLPVKRIVPVTSLAIDRLQDKTVMVRRNAMQVRDDVYNHFTFPSKEINKNS